MKILSLAGRWRGFLAGACLLLTGAFSAYTQTTNTNVSVIITAPTNGALFTARTNIQLDAVALGASNDAVAVVFVATPSGHVVLPPFAIYLGLASNGVATGPPGSQQQLFALTWTNALVGTWAITAQTVNSNGQEDAGSPPVVITVQPGSILSVDIASPTNGAIFSPSANIQLIAGASESGGGTVSNVQFFDGLKSLGVVSNGVVVDPPGSPGLPPGSLAYTLVWSNAPVGIHVLTAVAVDGHGQWAISIPVTILVGTNFPPVVRITIPPNNSVFHAPVDIALLVYAHDFAGYVASVQFLAGSNSLGFGLPVTSAEPPEPFNFQTNTFELIWSNAPVSTNAITAVAIDNMGLAATSAPVNITILPQPPPLTNEVAVVSIVAADPIAIEGTNCWSWPGLANTNAPPTWSNWVSPTALWRWFTNCGPEDATFAVWRAGATNSSLTVPYSIRGTASNGVDYAALPGLLTIPAGQTEAMITIVPMDNQTNSATNKAVETVVLSLTLPTNNPTNYVLGFPRRAEAIIVYSESPHSVLTGAVLGDHSFRVNTEGPDGAWFRVDYTSDGIGWTSVCTNQVVNGSIEFADPDASGSLALFYRAVPLPDPPANQERRAK